MNRKLQQAEDALRDYLPEHPDGVTLVDIFEQLRKHDIKGPELRAAVWTLRAAGRARFDRGKVFPAADRTARAA